MKVLFKNSSLVFQSKKTYDIDLSSLEQTSGFYLNDDNTYRSSSSGALIFAPIPEDGYTSLLVTVTSGTTERIAILTQKDTPVAGGTPSFATGETVTHAISETGTFTLPSDAKYICFNVIGGATNVTLARLS